MKVRCGIFISMLSAVFGMSACADEARSPCSVKSYQGIEFTVCHFDAANDTIRTYLNDANNAPHATFSKLKAAVEQDGKTLVFAMNGGMYHADRKPVGLYIENGEKMQSLNINKGPGNFHMMPNGVFYVGKGGAGVLRSDVYAHMKLGVKVHSATQSGPMLVIDGALHPKFNKDSKSRYVRNGVGVKEGDVYFVISSKPVNFHSFASFFKDVLQTPNALYLDGGVSKLYAPDLNRNDMGLPLTGAMGPIIAVVEAKG